MIGLDANVLVRYVMQDDARQSARATRLVESFSAEEPGFIPLAALVELVCVLSASYGLSRAQIAQVLETLVRSKELIVERAALANRALARFSVSGADFADALIESCAKDAGCAATMTFDVGATKAAGMTLVP